MTQHALTFIKPPPPELWLPLLLIPVQLPPLKDKALRSNYDSLTSVGQNVTIASHLLHIIVC